jgi:hypothetical protein
MQRCSSSGGGCKSGGLRRREGRRRTGHVDRAAGLRLTLENELGGGGLWSRRAVLWESANRSSASGLRTALQAHSHAHMFSANEPATRRPPSRFRDNPSHYLRRKRVQRSVVERMETMGSWKGKATTTVAGGEQNAIAIQQNPHVHSLLFRGTLSTHAKTDVVHDDNYIFRE